MDPKQFKKLQNQWYKKLKASGFEDAEETIKVDGKEYQTLKSWSNFTFSKVTQPNWEAKSEYYTAASSFLHEHSFSSEQERHMWELHSEGVSYRDIVDKIKEKGNKSTTIHHVFTTLNKLKKLMLEKLKQDRALNDFDE